MNPKFADAFHTLGSALLSSSPPEFADAIARLEEAKHLDPKLESEINPELAKAYFDWGVSLDKAGKQELAEEAIDKAKQLDAKYARLWRRSSDAANYTRDGESRPRRSRA